MTKETAMKILKKLHSKSLFAERTALETLIPELTESEGEKIRKRVLFSLQKDFMATKNSGCSTKDLEDCIAWLEKQGSSSIKWQKNTADNKPTINHSVLMKTVDGIAEGEWDGKYWHQYRWSAQVYDSNVLYWIELSNLDEQGDQKPILDFKASNWYISKVDGKIHDMTYNPIDKAEPKFKIDDFIINDYCMGRIIEITNDAYLLDTGQGISFSCHSTRLWDIINDAKEGDILAGKIDGDSYILIFKTIKDGWIETYGHYYNAINRFCVPSQLFCRSYQGTFTPATEEQRDLLFQKIQEEGYEFDFDKKELKIVDWREHIKFEPNSPSIIDENTAWSDEDKNVLEDIEEAIINYWHGDTQDILLDWLKSLKDRIGG